MVEQETRDDRSGDPTEGGNTLLVAERLATTVSRGGLGDERRSGRPGDALSERDQRERHEQQRPRGCGAERDHADGNYREPGAQQAPRPDCCGEPSDEQPLHQHEHRADEEKDERGGSLGQRERLLTPQ